VAMDKNGIAIPGATTGGGLVTGIGLDSGQVMLVVGSQQIPVSSVVGIATG